VKAICLNLFWKQNTKEQPTMKCLINQLHKSCLYVPNIPIRDSVFSLRKETDICFKLLL